MENLVAAMDKNGVGCAALTGCPLKKSWVATDQPAPKHPLYDDGDLYFYSMTDALVAEDLAAWREGSGDGERFALMACGFNLGDMGVGAEASRLFKRFPTVRGIGEVILQSDDYNNMTLKGSNWTYDVPALSSLLATLAERQAALQKPQPFVFYSEARSVTTKPYREAFEYVESVGAMCEMQPAIDFLWSAAGVFVRGLWEGYPALLHDLLQRHSNLHVSLTPLILGGKLKGMPRETSIQLCEAFPDRVTVGTQVRGAFVGRPPQEFTDQIASYDEQCRSISKFLEDLAVKVSPEVAAKVRYGNAARLFGYTDAPHGPPAAKPAQPLPPLTKKKSLASVKGGIGVGFIQALAYGGGTSKKKVCEVSRTDVEWETIDCHLHLLDFLQKSSGTSAALKAMDGCKVQHAVVFGMPCCKKWCFYRAEQPLYYQDDNAPCYVYAYADQMVADAWLALEDADRKRFAPMFASFDPTDLGAVEHVRRMHAKYPKMGRGVGEVMCRHDDLTTMLLDKEVPRVNHPAMDPIYRFCVEVGLPICVHHNADRVGDADGGFHYVAEVREVLRKHPKLKFVWVCARAAPAWRSHDGYTAVTRRRLGVCARCARARGACFAARFATQTPRCHRHRCTPASCNCHAAATGAHRRRVTAM